MKTLLIALAISFVGCGPSAQQRYDTALSILDREQKKMDTDFDEHIKAHSQAWDAAYLEINGESVTKQVEEDQADPANNETSPRLEAFSKKWKDPNSRERKVYDRIMASYRGGDEYEKQHDRVERAKQMVKDAEAALNK